MNERAYARREAMRNNQRERNISPRRITQWDFIRLAQGSALCSGTDAPLLGDALIPQLVARYRQDHTPTVLLTGSTRRMQYIHELVSRGMPAIYFDRTSRNYHTMYRQSAASIRQQIYEAASRTINGAALDDLMRFLAAVITLTEHYYPLSLQAISALLQLPHEEIIQLARETQLADDLISILARSSDTCHDLRSVIEAIEYAMSGIADPDVESGISLETAIGRGVPMIVFWQVGNDQRTLNRLFAEDLKAALAAYPGIRVVVDSVTFANETDPLLTLLTESMENGLLSLVIISTSACTMMKNDRFMDNFPSIFLSSHATPALTERHTAVFGNYMHSEEHLTVHNRRPLHIHQDRQWAVSDSSRLKIRAIDLTPPPGLFGTPEENVVCQLGQTLYLVNRRFFFRQ